MLVVGEVAHPELPSSIILKELRTKKATSTGFFFALFTILKVSLFAIQHSRLQDLDHILELFERRCLIVSSTDWMLSSVPCLQSMSLTFLMSTCCAMKSASCPAQFRLRRDFQDPAYLGPRIIDKLVIALITATLCKRWSRLPEGHNAFQELTTHSGFLTNPSRKWPVIAKFDT